MTALSIDPRRQARRIEVLRLRGRRRLRLIAAFAGVAAVAVLGWWVVYQSPFFDVDVVEIEGAARTSVEDLVMASGITEGQPLVDVDVNAARDAMVTLPWVETVTSERSLSGEVTFAITERAPVAVIPGEVGWLLVDSDGRVLDTTSTVPADVVVVDGTKWAVTPGGWIGEGALPALDVAALLPSGLRPKVASIQTTPTDLELILFGGGRVALGDTSDLEQKFLSALTLLVQLDLRCLDRIDVRAPSVPVLTRMPGCS
jgi:cell division protein FtsQ